MLAYRMLMPGEHHQLDKDMWKELPDKTVNKSGNVFVGKGYHAKFDVRVFAREIKDDE